jgi:hypothetical protein
VGNDAKRDQDPQGARRARCQGKPYHYKRDPRSGETLALQQGGFLVTKRWWNNKWISDVIFLKCGVSLSQQMGKVAFVGNISTFLCLSYNLLDTQVYYFTVMFLGHKHLTQAGVVLQKKDTQAYYILLWPTLFHSLFLSCCSFELKLLLLYLCISHIFYSQEQEVENMKQKMVRNQPRA